MIRIPFSGPRPGWYGWGARDGWFRVPNNGVDPRVGKARYIYRAQRPDDGFVALEVPASAPAASPFVAGFYRVGCYFFPFGTPAGLAKAIYEARRSISSHAAHLCDPQTGREIRQFTGGVETLCFYLGALIMWDRPYNPYAGTLDVLQFNGGGTILAANDPRFFRLRRANTNRSLYIHPKYRRDPVVVTRVLRSRWELQLPERDEPLQFPTRAAILSFCRRELGLRYNKRIREVILRE